VGVRCPLGFTSANSAIRAWDQFVGFHAKNIQVDYSPFWDVAIKSNQDGTIIEDCDTEPDLQSQGPHPTNLGNIIRNNVVHGCSIAGTCIFAKGASRNTQVYGNVIHMTGRQQPFDNGIGLGGATGGFSGPECINCVAYDNVVINEGSGTTQCFNTRGAKDSAFYNNVGINCDTMIELGNSGDGTITNSLDVKNNIFSCGGGTAYNQGGATGTVIDYNNFFNCSGIPSQAHAITGNPLFVNPLSDWHLQVGSPAHNSGTTTTFTSVTGGTIDVSKDIGGVTRIQPWALGIYAGNSSSGDTTPPLTPTGLLIR
jgi:hypothetical protein